MDRFHWSICCHINIYKVDACTHTHSLIYTFDTYMQIHAQRYSWLQEQIMKMNFVLSDKLNTICQWVSCDL